MHLLDFLDFLFLEEISMSLIITLICQMYVYTFGNSKALDLVKLHPQDRSIIFAEFVLKSSKTSQRQRAQRYLPLIKTVHSC